MPEGRKVRIRVRTANCVYVGDFLIPPMRSRVSDAINEEQRLFISLTDVVIDGRVVVAGRRHVGVDVIADLGSAISDLMGVHQKALGANS